MDIDPRLVGAVIATLVLVLAIVAATAKPKQKPVLDPNVWMKFPLKQVDRISHNTAVYRFALPKPDDILGLPIGQHISVQASIDGKPVMRSYTPTSSDDDKGHFDLLIKSYPTGNISKYVAGMKVGDQLTVKGPKGQMNYKADLALRLGMIAGGTGITPMLQIIRASLKNPLDLTHISLIYANVTADDILLKEELDELERKHSNRFKVYHVLNNPPAGWSQGVGFVSEDTIRERLPSPSKTPGEMKILLCGPPPMMTAMKKHLDAIGYEKPRTVSKKEDQVFMF
ncbi:NADH-cytochrome b5 reductase [Cystobasidiomycetes sp. EMM_F5]